MPRGRSKTKDPNDIDDDEEVAAPSAGRRRTKDPNDEEEEQVAAPSAGRRRTKDPNDDEELAAPSSGHIGSKESRDDDEESTPRERIYVAGESPRLTYNNEAILRRYRATYNLGASGKLASIYIAPPEDLDAPDDAPDAPDGAESSAVLRRYDSDDELGLRYRTPDPSPRGERSTLRDAGLPDADETSSANRFSEMVIEDVGESGEDRPGEEPRSLPHQALEVTALPGTMVALNAAARAKTPDTQQSDERYSSERTPSAKSSEASSENSLREDVSEDELLDERAPEVGDPYEDEMAGLVEINNTAILCAFITSYYWAAMAAGVLFANVWQYIFNDSNDLAHLTAEIAVKHARVHLAEVLRPAVATMRVLDLAFRSGAVTSRLDYIGLHRVLAPHFLLQPTLLEVELVDPPEAIPADGRGSLLASRTECPDSNGLPQQNCTGNLLELRTRVEDCEETGCLANSSIYYPNGSWYESGRTFSVPLNYTRAPDGSWFGPCVGSCDAASYSWVGRIAGGPDALFTGQGTAPPRGLVARATLDIQDLLAATQRAVAMSSDGEKRTAVMICTEMGQVMAGIDSEGSAAPANMPEIWRMSEKWAEGADESFVRAGAGKPKSSEGFMLSSWRLESFTHTYVASDWHLRLVIAVPDSAFKDAVLYPLHPWAIAVAACPVVGATCLLIRLLYKRCLKKYKKSKIAAAATNLRNNLDRSIKDATVHEASNAFSHQAQLANIEFQDELMNGIRRGERHSVVFEMSWLKAAQAKSGTKRNSAATSFNNWMGRRQTVQEAEKGMNLGNSNKRGSLFGSVLGGFMNSRKRHGSMVAGQHPRMSAREIAIAKETLTKARTKVRS